MRPLSVPKGLAAVAWLIAYSLPLTAFPQTIIYVNDDATGANNGTSWPNAYRFLQDGLADAADTPGTTEVWVAAGTYRPDESTANPTGTGDRTASFQLINNVLLYGSFAGTETSPSQRVLPVPPERESILSGDLNADDGLNFANNAENSYHVTTANNVGAGAVLNGISIEGGNATGSSSPHQNGGGMYATSAGPTIRYCTFRGNKAYSGGSFFLQNGFAGNNAGPTIHDCLFSGNLCSVAGDGSALSALDVGFSIARTAFIANSGGPAVVGYDSVDSIDSIVVLDQCTFTSNSRGGFLGYVGTIIVTHCTFGSNGRGLEIGGETLTVSDCAFTANISEAGGAVYVNGADTTIIANCAFNGNSAQGDGGAITIATDGGNVTVKECAFTMNSAGFSGGGAQVYGDGNPSVAFINCSFYGNRVGEVPGGGYGGGGLAYGFSDGSCTLVNCVFSGNSVVGGYGLESGGGACYLHLVTQGGTIVSNCSFWGNSVVGAQTRGGGIYTHGPTLGLAVRNCILADNFAPSASQIFSLNTPTVGHSCVQGGWPGAGNIDAHPLFADPDGPDNIVGTLDDDLRISPGSPCIDAGDNSAIPSDVADLDADGDTTEPTPLDADLGRRREDDPLTADTGVGTFPVVDMGAFEWKDCNVNGIDDGQDIATGNSQDVDGDGVPDECSFWASNVGVWNNPVNWDPQEVPDNNPQAGRVFVPTIDDATAQVTLDIDAEVNGLSVVDGASLDVSAGDLTIATSAGIVNGGSITVDGTHAIFAGTGPILLGRGGGGCPRAERGCSPPVLRLTALAHLESASVSVSTGSTEIAGSATAAIFGPVTLDGDGQLLLDGDCVLDVGGDLALRATGGGGCPRGEPSDTTIWTGAELSGSSRHSDPGLRDNSAAPSGLEYIATGYQGLTPLATHRRPFGAGHTDVPLTPHPLPLTPSPQRDAERGCSPPVLRIMAFSTMDMEGSLRLETSGDVAVEAGTTVMLAGDLDNRSTDPSIFDWASGPLTLDGTAPQSVEAAGEDRGASTNGLLGNFAIGTLTLAAGATANILDAFDNQQDGVAACDEALYVDTLAVGNGATLNTAGCRVYYRNLTNNGSIPRLGIDVLKIGSGDGDGDGDVDLADYAAMVDCTTGPDAGPLPPGCDIFDFASDGDIDLADFGAIQTLVDPT